MGLFPPMPPGWQEAFDKKMAEQQAAIAAAGFTRLKGWFGKLCDEFYKSQGYSAGWLKDGEIYGHYQVLELLGLEQPYVGPEGTRVWKPPAPALPWLQRKEELKAELGDYDT